ncbi:MAG: hypothetical protein KDD69_18730, partial [Bdellovibrionales bacterium]|nr:hypothetical protein [Bdellovibrionales bacterium]
ISGKECHAVQRAANPSRGSGGAVETNSSTNLIPKSMRWALGCGRSACGWALSCEGEYREEH